VLPLAAFGVQELQQGRLNVVGVGIEQFGFYLTLVLALLFCLVYLAVGLRVLREDSMGNKVAQFYGYSVCLVAIISTMVSIGSLAGALMECGGPS
jgi:heme O synthase-like polyprenyltransferase